MSPSILTVIGAVVIFLLARKAIQKHRAGTLKRPSFSQVFTGVVILFAMLLIGSLIKDRPEMASIFAAWVVTLSVLGVVGFKLYQAKKNKIFRLPSNIPHLIIAVATFVFLSLAMGYYFIKKGAHTFALLYVSDEDPIRVGIILLVGILSGWMTYRLFQLARSGKLFRTHKGDEKGWLKFTRTLSLLISIVAMMVGVFHFASGSLPPVLLVVPLTFGVLAILEQVEPMVPVERIELLRLCLRGIARLVGMLGFWLTTGFAYYAAVCMFPPLQHYFVNHIGTDAFGWTAPMRDWGWFFQIIFSLVVLACFAARLVIDMDKMVKPTK